MTRVSTKIYQRVFPISASVQATNDRFLIQQFLEGKRAFGMFDDTVFDRHREHPFFLDDLLKAMGYSRRERESVTRGSDITKSNLPINVSQLPSGAQERFFQANVAEFNEFLIKGRILQDDVGGSRADFVERFARNFSPEQLGAFYGSQIKRIFVRPYLTGDAEGVFRILQSRGLLEPEMRNELIKFIEKMSEWSRGSEDKRWHATDALVDQISRSDIDPRLRSDLTKAIYEQAYFHEPWDYARHMVSHIENFGSSYPLDVLRDLDHHIRNLIQKDLLRFLYGNESVPSTAFSARMHDQFFYIRYASGFSELGIYESATIARAFEFARNTWPGVFESNPKYTGIVEFIEAFQNSGLAADDEFVAFIQEMFSRLAEKGNFNAWTLMGDLSRRVTEDTRVDELIAADDDISKLLIPIIAEAAHHNEENGLEFNSTLTPALEKVALRIPELTKRLSEMGYRGIDGTFPRLTSDSRQL
jgi:hypothetical protein